MVKKSKFKLSISSRWFLPVCPYRINVGSSDSRLSLLNGKLGEFLPLQSLPLPLLLHDKLLIADTINHIICLWNDGVYWKKMCVFILKLFLNLTLIIWKLSVRQHLWKVLKRQNISEIMQFEWFIAIANEDFGAFKPPKDALLLKGGGILTGKKPKKTLSFNLKKLWVYIKLQ